MAFPGTYNFKYYRGDTFQFIIFPKNSSNGTSFDLTGYSAIFRIANKRGPNATQYLAAATVDSASDTVTCTIAPGVGRNLAEGTYVYDVQVQNSNSTVIYTLLTGSINSIDDITGAI